MYTAFTLLFILISYQSQIFVEKDGYVEIEAECFHVRTFSTGTEDNGIHIGIDGYWPESGQRMQWCEGKSQWTWESKQRTDSIHCGEPMKIFLEIIKPGLHTIQFSMRENGFTFDKFVLTSKPLPTEEAALITQPSKRG